MRKKQTDTQINGGKNPPPRLSSARVMNGVSEDGEMKPEIPSPPTTRSEIFTKPMHTPSNA